MFWDKNYAPSQNIEALLEKEDATVEEFLDDDDILQECKSLKKSIVKYFTRPDVIKRLIQMITTEPSKELPFAQRFRHANMACEILTLGLPSMDEKILSDPEILNILYSYLENEPPLNPLLSSFFNKTLCMLFTKKPEQDWFLYQQMCLQLLEYLKSRKNLLDLVVKHFETPVIPELILQLMKDFEGGQLKRNLYEWLTEEKLVNRLIAILGNPQESDKHSNVTDFLCDLIKQGRTMRQIEHENDSFEPAFDGSNPLLKSIESEETIEALLNVILEPNAQESAIVSGITVVLTLIKPTAIVDESYTDRSKFIQNREKQIQEQITNTVIRMVSPRLNDFIKLLKNPPNMPNLHTTAAHLSPPFGVTRLQVCRVFTVLLQTKNEDISKAICDTDFFNIILSLFKTYCWNNFLHSEFEKCIQIIFDISTSNSNNSAQGSTIVHDGSFSKGSNNEDNSNNSASVSVNLFDYMVRHNIVNNEETAGDKVNDEGHDDDDMMPINKQSDSEIMEEKIENNENGQDDIHPDLAANDNLKSDMEAVNTELVKNEESLMKGDNSMNDMINENIDEGKAKLQNDEQEIVKDNSNTSLEVQNGVKAESKETPASSIIPENQLMLEDDSQVNQHDTTEEDEAMNEQGIEDENKLNVESSPSALQTHLIVNCKLIKKLVDCWQHNTETMNSENSRRLGYMGHLIKILKHITNCISESEHIGALIENTLSDDANQLKLWQSISNPTDGDLTKALATQNKMLANCNAHEACDYGHHLPKDFLSDSNTWDYVMSTNVLNSLGGFSDPTFADGGVDDGALEMIEIDDNAANDFNLFQFGPTFDDDEDDEDEYTSGLGGGGAGSRNNNIGAIGSGIGSSNSGNTGSKDVSSRSFFSKNVKCSPNLPALSNSSMCSNPWYNSDPFDEIKANTSTNSSNVTPWSADFSSDNFADFDSYFSAFTSDLGESLSESKPTGDAKNDAMNTNSTPTAGTENADMGNSNDKKDFNSITASNVATKSGEEYDNNANIEKNNTSNQDSWSAFKKPAYETSADDKIFETAIGRQNVRSLHSVMQDSEDDLEDDEGMWTKPLGDSSKEQADENPESPILQKTSTLMNLVNGTNQNEEWNEFCQSTVNSSNSNETTKVDHGKVNYTGNIEENTVSNEKHEPENNSGDKKKDIAETAVKMEVEEITVSTAGTTSSVATSPTPTETKSA